MKLTLQFTDDEILSSLKAHGYEVIRIAQKHEDHIHGSRHITTLRWDFIAIKEGTAVQFEKAFEQLIKSKLLTP